MLLLWSWGRGLLRRGILWKTCCNNPFWVTLPYFAEKISAMISLVPGKLYCGKMELRKLGLCPVSESFSVVNERGRYFGSDIFSGTVDCLRYFKLLFEAWCWWVGDEQISAERRGSEKLMFNRILETVLYKCFKIFSFCKIVAVLSCYSMPWTVCQLFVQVLLVYF